MKIRKWILVKNYWYEVRDSHGCLVSQGDTPKVAVERALRVAVHRRIAVEIVGEPVEESSTVGGRAE